MYYVIYYTHVAGIYFPTVFDCRTFGEAKDIYDYLVRQFTSESYEYYHVSSICISHHCEVLRSIHIDK